MPKLLLTTATLKSQDKHVRFNLPYAHIGSVGERKIYKVENIKPFSLITLKSQKANKLILRKRLQK